MIFEIIGESPDQVEIRSLSTPVWEVYALLVDAGLFAYTYVDGSEFYEMDKQSVLIFGRCENFPMFGFSRRGRKNPA